MFNKQLQTNIKDLDLMIGKLNKELMEIEDDSVKYDDILVKLDKLTALRCKLYESKVSNSMKSTMASSLLGIASIVIILKYEETEVITSKTFDMARSMLRGG